MARPPPKEDNLVIMSKENCSQDFSTWRHHPGAVPTLQLLLGLQSTADEVTLCAPRFFCHTSEEEPSRGWPLMSSRWQSQVSRLIFSRPTTSWWPLILLKEAEISYSKESHVSETRKLDCIRPPASLSSKKKKVWKNNCTKLLYETDDSFWRLSWK